MNEQPKTLEFAPPRNRDEAAALRWLESYTPEERTARLKLAYWQFMQDQRQEAARVSGE